MRLRGVSVAYSNRGFFSTGNNVVALRNVSLCIGRHDKVGIIGSNGSGKSTLLRVMAGVLRPDSGVVDDGGISCAFLSLNAGFDADLSGVRNIIMHGMLMGMTRREAASRVSAVTEMSGLGDAINRRVSTYSTGMRGRLCFSTAINLNPDMLFLDEILSVGDQEFREKSQQIILDRFKQDKAIVFVSHNVSMVKRLCQRAIWLDGGQKVAEGDVDEVIALYQRANAERQNNHS